MLEVFLALVLMLVALLVLLSLPFWPGRSLSEDMQDMRKASAELKGAILDALLPKLEWVCRALTCFLCGFQEAMRYATAWDRDYKELSKAMEEAGVKPRSMPFNDYLYYFHGIGNQEEKGEAS